MTSSKQGIVLVLSILASSLAGCAAPTAPDSTDDSTAALDSEKGAEGKVTPQGLFGGTPTLASSYITAQKTVPFSGTNFSTGGSVYVGLYVASAGGQWTFQDESVTVTASTTTCARTFCIEGGAITGSVSWPTGKCTQGLALRAYDYGTKTWVTGTLPACNPVQ